MIKSERVKIIMRVLDRIYPSPPIPLDHTNIFELLVSVLLSAQCTDIRVNQVTPSLFKLANNPFDMKNIELEISTINQNDKNVFSLILDLLINSIFLSI